MATMTAKELKLDYFQVYDVADRPAEASVTVQGQFDKKPLKMQVTTLDYFANAVAKNGEPLYDKNAHLAWYRGIQEPEPVRSVVLENQFGKFQVWIGRGYGLLLPTHKVEPGTAFPEGLDHYKVYTVVDGAKAPDVNVKLQDQFRATGTRVGPPLYMAVPVTKKHGTNTVRIRNDRAHLLIFAITPLDIAKAVTLRNQFAAGIKARVTRSVMLAAPSIKLSWKAG